MAQGADAPPLEVLCFGEAIVDLLPDRRGRLRDVENFRKITGGAPCNVALGLARLGRRAGLMGLLGDDEFGYFLREAIEREGVCTDAVEMTDAAATGHTFVALLPNGDRTFTAPRAITADQMIRANDLDFTHFDRADILLFGTNQMIAPPQRATVLEAMHQADDRERFVVLDPNIRLHLWSDPEEVRPSVMRALGHVDLVKLNDEELEILGDDQDAATFYTQKLVPRGVSTLIATRARGGAEVFCGDLHVHVDAPPVDVVDTTGAGDGFVAGLLSGVLMQCHGAAHGGPEIREAVHAFGEQTWAAILSLGCFVGSHVCTTLGATTGLPKREEIPDHIWEALRDAPPPYPDTDPAQATHVSEVALADPH